MHLSLATLPLAALLCGGLFLAADDFPRERGGPNDAAKDALEGERPPAFVAREWLNTESPIELGDQLGKVVLIDFWGTW